jgi:ribonuclease HI
MENKRIKVSQPEEPEEQSSGCDTTEVTVYKNVLLYFDGASKGNPGKGGAGWCMMTEGLHVQGYKYLGDDITNNVAEYEALLHGLLFLISKKDSWKVEHLLIRGDSKLVIEQVQNRWKCNLEHLQELKKHVQNTVEDLKECCMCTSIRYEHVPRESNKEADKLSNVAVQKMSTNISYV